MFVMSGRLSYLMKVTLLFILSPLGVASDLASVAMVMPVSFCMQFIVYLFVKDGPDLCMNI